MIIIHLIFFNAERNYCDIDSSEKEELALAQVKENVETKSSRFTSDILELYFKSMFL